MYENLIDEYEGEFGKGRSIDDVVDCVEELPPMPDVTTKALKLVDDPNTAPEDMAEVIMRDPAMTVSILRSANSAAMGQQQEVKTLDAAILLLGMSILKSKLMASALRRWNRTFGPVEKLVWEKSLGAASASPVLCEQLSKRYRDELYLTALMHNLGQIVLLSHKEIGQTYRQVLSRMIEHNEDFVTAEREIIGFSHPLVGALVARKWGFPMPTCQTIMRYADPFEGLGEEEDEKLAMLKLAVGISMTSGYGCPEGFSADTEEMNTLAGMMGFDESTREADLKTAIEETKTRFSAEASVYA
jgi:HD-like signal output (HDOD) protein